MIDWKYLPEMPSEDKCILAYTVGDDIHLVWFDYVCKTFHFYSACGSEVLRPCDIMAWKELPPPPPPPKNLSRRSFSRSPNMLNNLASECLQCAIDHGFHDHDRSGLFHYNPDRINSLLMMAVSEVGEACEAVRKNDWENFQEEVADIFIRMLDMSALLGIDLDKVIREKIDYNKTRPRLHGGKRL